VKKILPDGGRVLYALGGMYEVEKDSGGTVIHTTMYYLAGGAMREEGTLYWLLERSGIRCANSLTFAKQMYI
jgi:hypothetical protein